MSSATIRLDDLAAGMPGITPRIGAVFAEAAVLCFEEHSHSSGVPMPVDGDLVREISVAWSALADPEQAKRAWADRQVTTEHGACCVAALLIAQLMDLVVVERSRKGTGFDYWLGKSAGDAQLFQKRARLEVSGIAKGTEPLLMARIRQKVNQTKVSDGVRLPAVIAVVEFGEPRSRLKRR